MPDYQLSKIYKIVCNVTGETYVGSTTYDTLAKRLSKHTAQYKQYINKTKKLYVSSFQIIEKGDYYIDLVENYPCNNRDELRKREREWCDMIQCVNKYRPYITIDEQKEYTKTYRNNHKEEGKQHQIIFLETNKDYHKIYRDNNREQYNEYHKEYQKEYRKKKTQMKNGIIII